ncbi:threonine--tRNA ligase [Candidatus Campbellbacteria bacterium]|nr:MAG: threonine--tRNA ligase [Candidatus Campbellbacteria bacterium]
MEQEKHTQIYKIRHSLSHILAMSVLDKYKDAKIAIGPVIENGFYYDIDFGENKISESDLKDFQKKMKKIISQKLDFSELDKSIEEIKEIYKDNPYKTELIEDLEKEGKKANLVQTGEDFVDLCAGGHVSNTSEISTDSFMLEKTAGAYWRGDEKNKMLTRIYGVAFETKDDLTAYKEQKAEAEKRDHRKLGKELDLFTFSEHVGAGLPLFTEKGTALRDAITDRIYKLQSKYGWRKVTSPHITKKELYEISGHWNKFGDELFKVKGKSDTQFVMKPMNCPHHTQIFASKARSYKDLPLRFGENGVVYRDEQAGELLGLARVRSITQDDGHAFVTPEQIKDEVKNIISVIEGFYTPLGLFKEGNFWVSLSVSDPKEPEKYMINEDGLFLKAEKILEEIAQEENLPYKRVEGEAAFYGPKLDFQFKDALGRERQLATVQLDFSMPKRFGLVYTDKEGQKQHPVMIHRAIAGSLERFLAIYIEHTAGNFPFFLSPVQARVISVSDETAEYAENIYNELKNDFRVELDDSKISFGKKVRMSKKEKLPYFIIVGAKDMEKNKVTLESREGESRQVSLEELKELFKKENLD